MTTPTVAAAVAELGLNLTLFGEGSNYTEYENIPPPLGPMPWGAVHVWVAYHIKLYYTPLLVGVGVVSNLVAFVILSHNSFGCLSSSHYLRAIFCVNVIFLLMLLCTWLTQLGYNVYDRPFLCQLTFLLIDTSSFLMVWFSVAFCVDRYICICWPPEALHMCTPIRARVIITCLTVLTMCVYLNTSLTVGVVYTKTYQPICTYLQLPFRNNKGFIMLDCTVNHILPFTTLLCLTTHMCHCLHREWHNPYAETGDPSKVKALTLTYLLCFTLLNLPQELWYLITIFHPSTVVFRNPAVYLMKTVFQYLGHTVSGLSSIILLATYPMFRQYLKLYLKKLGKVHRINCQRCRARRRSTVECMELYIENIQYTTEYV